MKALTLFLWHSIISSLPFYSLRHWYAKRALGLSLDKDVALHRGIKLFCLSGITIRKNTTINRGVTLDGRGGLEIASNVSISEDVKILTASHLLHSSDFELDLAPVRIDQWVWIGVNAIVLPNVVVHEGAVIAAGSVVTKDVSPWTVVAGNPAKIIGHRKVTPDYSPLWKPSLF